MRNWAHLMRIRSEYVCISRSLGRPHYSDDFDRGPPISCAAGSAVGRVTDLAACGRAVSYSRDRCRAIACLFSTSALRLELGWANSHSREARATASSTRFTPKSGHSSCECHVRYGPIVERASIIRSPHRQWRVASVASSFATIRAILCTYSLFKVTASGLDLIAHSAPADNFTILTVTFGHVGHSKVRLS